jgi:hypothetical protein
LALTIPAVTVDLQFKWTAEYQHPVSDVSAVGIAHFGHRQIAVRLDLQYSQIGFLVGADHFRGVALLVVVQVT